MLFWFRDSCHWYREATLFRVRALGAVTQNKSAVVNPMEKEQRMCHTLRHGRSCACVCVWVSSNLPVLYTINCDLAQTVEGTVWRTSVRCGLSVLRLHFFSDCAVSDLGSERREREEEHFTQTPTFKDTNRLPQTHEVHVCLCTACPCAHIHTQETRKATRAAGMDRCPPYLVVIYDCSSVEATVIWEMMAILIW